MRTKTFCCALLLLLPLQAVADDDCDFDQAERLRNNLELQRHYPGSRYVKEEYTLLIPQGEDEIRLNIGGCVHYGVSIERKTKRTAKFNSDEALMKAALDLVKEYSQGLIEYQKVAQTMIKKDWQDASSDHNYYLLNYDDFSTFEIYRREEGRFTVIGVNYYQ